MKHALFLTVLLSLSDIFIFSQSPDEINIGEIFRDFETITSFSTRIEGSSAEKRTVEYLKSRIEPRARVIDSGFEEADRFHSFSRILRVTIPGSGENTLMIVVPLSAAPDDKSAPDGTINLALALGLIDRYTRYPPTATVSIVFIGADTPDGESGGTDFFLKTFPPENPTTVVYLSFTDFPTKVLFRSGGNGYVTPSQIIRGYSIAAKKAGFTFITYGNEIQALRVAQPGKISALGYFLSAGIPGFAMESADRGPGAETDGTNWIKSILSFFDNFMEENVPVSLNEWDQHYLLFQSRSSIFLISEGEYVFLFILVLLAVLIFGLVRLKKIRKYISLLLRNFWNLPVQYLLIFIFLFLGTFVLERILEFRNSSTLWETFPLLFFLLKITVSIFLFAVFLRILKEVSFSHNGSFYSAASLFILLIDTFISASINISLSYYFLWAVICAFLFTIPRNRYLKLLFFLLSPVWMIKVAFDLFTAPELDLCRILLFSRLQGNLLLAFFILPFMLMLMRLDFLFRHPVERKRGFTAMLAFAFSGLVLLIMTAYISFYQSPDPQPLTITETYDDEHSSHIVRFESPASLGSFAFRRADRLFSIDTRERFHEIPIDDIPDDITIETGASGFLDRDQFRITISSGLTHLSTVDLKLFSEKDFIIYDTNFPFSLSSPGEKSSAVMYIGRFPPSPLVIEFTVPRRSALTCVLTVTCSGLPEPWSIMNKEFNVSRNFIFMKSFPLINDPGGIPGN